MKTKFDASDITVLQGLDAVRMRPTMYVGVLDAHTPTLLLGETLCLGAGGLGCRERVNIDVRIMHEDGYDACIVSDDTLGLPRGSAHRLMTQLHACFDEKRLHETATFCRAGISVMNALSRHCVLEVLNDEHHHVASFMRGHAMQPSEFPPEEQTGNNLLFIPDSDIIGTSMFDMDSVRALIASAMHQLPGLTITLEEQ